MRQLYEKMLRTDQLCLCTEKNNFLCTEINICALHIWATVQVSIFMTPDNDLMNEAAQSLWKRACSSTSKTNNHFKRLHKGAARKIQDFQGATIRPIVPRQKHSIVFIVHH